MLLLQMRQLAADWVGGVEQFEDYKSQHKVRLVRKAYETAGVGKNLSAADIVATTVGGREDKQMVLGPHPSVHVAATSNGSVSIVSRSTLNGIISLKTTLDRDDGNDNCDRDNDGHGDTVKAVTSTARSG